MKIKIIFLAFILMLITCGSVLADDMAENEHPFMLVQKSEYEHLRRLAEKSPWKELKETAIEDAHNLVFNPDKTRNNLQTRSNALSAKISASALSYILDPGNKEFYVQNIVDLIAYWDPQNTDGFFDELYSAGNFTWDNTIPPGSAMANTIIALDIIHDELTPAQLMTCESAVEQVSEHYWATYEPHYIGVLGVRCLWAIYCRNWGRLTTAWKEYKPLYDTYISTNGVGRPGADYTMQRLVVAGLDSKAIIPYVMEYLDLDHDFFDNEVHKQFAEWAMGYPYTPALKKWCFGDTRGYATSAGEDRASIYMAFAADRFSEQAAKQASWLMKDVQPRGRLFNYLFLKEEFAEPEPPKSRIFPDGGAYFYENIDNPNSIACSMFNLSSEADGHGHKDTNSVSIAGFGETLTANSGYAGWQKSSGGFSWNYINDRAISGNTVLINYDYGDIKNPSTENDHQSKSGGGITKGFTSETFDYANGNSGNALPNGTHDRGLVMVAPQDNAGGYFVYLDKITTEASGNVVTIVHKPMSANYSELRENEEYNWIVNNDSGHNVNLSVFLATKPDNTEIIDGVVAGWNVTYLAVKSLLAKYVTGEDGTKKAATVLFPSDALNSKADMNRIEADDIQGAEIDFNNGIKDYIFTSEKEGIHTYYIPNADNKGYSYDKVRFDADSAMLRRNEGALGYYFTENGKSFMAGQQGFSAANRICIHMKNLSGEVWASSETDVTFYEYGVTGIKINGEEITPKQAKSGSITAAVPAGESKIELIIDDDARAVQIIHSQVANNILSRISVFDIVSKKAVLKNEIQDVDIRMADGISYIAKDTALSVFGSTAAESRDIEGTEYVPLRSLAEALGMNVIWKPPGLVFVSSAENGLDVNKDRVVIGLAYRLFNELYETIHPANPVTVDSISINGKELNKFRPYLYEYSMELFETDPMEVTVKTDMEYTVEKPEALPGKIVIRVRDGENESRYLINVSAPKYGIIVSASDTPEIQNTPENTLDGDMTTRWTSENDNWIMYDFGRIKKLTGLEIAWNLGDIRTTAFDVLVSEDGGEWNTVFSGRNSGTTMDFEKVSITPGKCRYVKINCHGNSLNSWNAILEVKFITEDTEFE